MIPLNWYQYFGRNCPSILTYDFGGKIKSGMENVSESRRKKSKNIKKGD
jgi:hypothetical protein